MSRYPRDPDESRSSFGKKRPGRQRPAPKNPRDWGAKCDLCPLRHSEPVTGDGPDDALFAVVGEAPGQNEVQAGIPFIGRSGEWLEARLTEVGKEALGSPLSRREVLLENAIACFPPGGDMKAFMQRAKKAHRELEDAKPAKEREPFHSPIDCCRPRLFYALGIPRCASCGKWDLKDATAVIANGLGKAPPPELPGGLSCTCEKPRWTKSKFFRVRGVLAAGNAALEALRGSSGIMDKQMYVFENAEKVK